MSRLEVDLFPLQTQMTRLTVYIYTRRNYNQFFVLVLRGSLGVWAVELNDSAWSVADYQRIGIIPLLHPKMAWRSFLSVFMDPVLCVDGNDFVLLVCYECAKRRRLYRIKCKKLETLLEIMQFFTSCGVCQCKVISTWYIIWTLSISSLYNFHFQCTVCVGHVCTLVIEFWNRFALVVSMWCQGDTHCVNYCELEKKII